MSRKDTERADRVEQKMRNINHINTIEKFKDAKNIQHTLFQRQDGRWGIHVIDLDENELISVTLLANEEQARKHFKVCYKQRAIEPE